MALAVSGSVSDCVSECLWQCFQWWGYFLTEHLALSPVLSLAVFLGVLLLVSVSLSGFLRLCVRQFLWHGF